MSWAALFVLLAGCAHAAAPSFSLPSSIVPLKHSLELTVDPSASVIDGRVNIEIRLAESTREIWLNAKDIAIEEAYIDGRAVAFESTTEFIGLHPSEPIGPGLATLLIGFQSKLDDQLAVGAYRRKIGGDWYAFTTFTPIEARRAFPCFDEPRFKTPWDIALRVPRMLTAVSNMREASVTEDSGAKRVRFETSPPLPAEVIAFAVGPFDILDGGIAGASTPVRAIVPKGRAAEGAAAIRNTAIVLPRLEAYTGIPYPFGKLDHLAVPDIEFGAVENPGLIAYRLRTLLLAPEADGQKSRPLRNLEAHEIAHQWFGNLVTQADWSEVWLSEGFATWLAAKTMDAEQPASRARLAAIVTRERIMRADPARGRAVRTAVDSRQGSTEVYNRLVYDKAAAVLLMLEHWLGESEFQQGLRAYLLAHRHRTATADDLASSLRTASGKNPGPALHAFLDNAGAPVVRGEVDCEKGELRLAQTGSATVPVCWRTDNASGCEEVGLDGKSIKLGACPSWIYWNASGAGYYRTAWTAAQLSQLRLSELSASERLTLAHDLRAQTNDKAARALLDRLAKDSEPEIAQAAREQPRP